MNKMYLIAATVLGMSGAPALASASAAAAPAAPKSVKAAAPAPQQAFTRVALTRQLDETFKSIDTNGDGVLSQAELAAAEKKGLEQRVAAVRARFEADFAKLDTNHDGQLSKAEFMAAAPQMPTTPVTGADALAQLDKNHDGKVTLDEFRAPRLAQFDRLDTNHDGVISPAERQAAMSGAAAKR